jgi:SAM-dependent methyltransferase
MLNLVKMKFYYEHVLTQVYSEGESPFHKSITADVIERFIDPLKLPTSAQIIDLGCGPGYFLDAMRDRGYNNMRGVTLSSDDLDICTRHGHRVVRSDMNFLDDLDESVDLLFCRHSLEHSPFPFLTLLEYNRVLKPRGVLYIEVPKPDSAKPQESNINHYSILGKTMWLNLLARSGFDVNWYEYEFPVKNTNNESETWIEQYYVFVCHRARSVDVK